MEEKTLFSKNSIIKLSKKANIQSISKDCISIIDIIIQEKLEKTIQYIIATNKDIIYSSNDIDMALQTFEYKDM